MKAVSGLLLCGGEALQGWVQRPGLLGLPFSIGESLSCLSLAQQGNANTVLCKLSRAMQAGIGETEAQRGKMLTQGHSWHLQMSPVCRPTLLCPSGDSEQRESLRGQEGLAPGG